MTTTQVGARNSVNGSGQTTLGLTNVQGNNNLLVVGSKITSTSLQMTAISGPNTAGWTRVGGPYSDNNASVRRQEIWIGVATGSGPYSTTLTFTWSASNAGMATDYQCLEFSSGYPWTTWTKDNNQTGGQNNAASTTHNFTGLTAIATNDLFIGTMRGSGYGTLTTPNPNCFIYIDTNGNPFFYGLDQPSGSLTRWIADTASIVSYSFCTILNYVNAWEVDATSTTASSASGGLSLHATANGSSATVSAASGAIDLLGIVSGSSATASHGTGTITTLGMAAGSSNTMSQGNGNIADVAPGVISGSAATASSATGAISLRGMVSGLSVTASLGSGTILDTGVIAGSSATASLANGYFLGTAVVYTVSSISRTYSSASGRLLPSPLYVPPSAGSIEPIWIELIDKNLVSQGPIQFVTITATLYYNAVGSYSILVPYSDALWNMMMSGDFMVNVNWQGLFTFGGKCEQPQYQDSIPGSIGAATITAGPFILLSGADYLALLANRIVYPTPSAAWSAQTAAGADAVSAMHTESAIKHYVNNNVGPAALASRRVSFLDLATDQTRGNTVSYTAKFGSGVDLNLMDVIRALIAQSGSNLGVSIVRNPLTHRLTFDCYVPRDLTGKAWFSEELGNLTAVVMSLTDPTCTDALVQGSGTQFIQQTAANATQWNKTEQFIDSSTETDANNLKTTAASAIASGAAGPTMAITTTNIPFLTYGRDYRVGDLVSVEVKPGVVYSDVVSSVTLTADPSQTPEITVVPTIGQAQNSTSTDLSVTAQLTARIRALEKKLATK
jgi:hypothetical protein